ncbi:hypothetical protein UFOVP130_26 [uncultured Caudovirales phage]|uniref:Uncharacterized protein n=1 Tax=uncultured Caudovirales phage TaxID=2100421 RepID=A0A6J5LGA7_9CAUD|nr:hypothetical protein UFOVP130_26 [uncultured Caudovirales phage]
MWWRIAVVALAFAAGFALDGPSNIRHDYWFEPKGGTYITCHRQGSFDPAVQFVLFQAPVMVRQVLQKPLPDCSGEGKTFFVRFPQPRTPDQMKVQHDEMRRDAAGLVLSVCSVVALVSLCNSARRRWKCRNR